MVPRVAVDRKRSPIAAGMSEPAVRVFPRTAMPVVKVTTISPVVATAGAVPRVVVRPTTSPALCDMRPLQSCGAKSSFALPRVQVAVPLSVKSVAPPPPLPVVRVVKPRAQTSARPPLACPSVASAGKPVVVRCAPTPPPLASAAGLVVNQPEHVPSAHAGVTRRGKRKSIGPTSSRMQSLKQPSKPARLRSL